MQRTIRSHVYMGERRTMVGLDVALARFLALKLGVTPETETARQAIRAWGQGKFTQHNDQGRALLSQ